MFGTVPLLIDSTYLVANCIQVSPSNDLPHICLGLILLITFLLNYMTCSTNSSLNSSNSIVSRFYNSSSLVSGLIIVQQSLSVKNFFKCFLISFFISYGLLDYFSNNALSKYSLQVNSDPFSSTNYSAKSLTTHMKLGKYSDKSSTL
jgi:hypothetical protein